MTGIPVSRLWKRKRKSCSVWANVLHRRVIGQDEA
jgi:ATP-dependent Clp protease ATP-binding subunit ClpA